MLGADGRTYRWWEFPAKQDPTDDPFHGTHAAEGFAVGSYHVRLGRWRLYWRSRGGRISLADVRHAFGADAKVNLFGGRVIWTWRWDSGQRGTGGGHLVLYPLIVEVYRVARRATPAEVEAAALRALTTEVAQDSISGRW